MNLQIDQLDSQSALPKDSDPPRIAHVAGSFGPADRLRTKQLKINELRVYARDPKAEATPSKGRIDAGRPGLRVSAHDNGLTGQAR
ncbi:MAG: hypothetical protein GC160_19515 [Acidobacteria bacterium]|nr:hypothetical protein [Acidobacteriota bacterium]